ncbi:MAG: hypothetical protein MI802_18550 [Desulfobacterales bacterium]|nr:hypothetical protein [Desulfobacterales bacterium]
MHIETNFYKIAAYADVCHVTAYASWDEKVAATYLKDWTRVCTTLYSNKKWAILIDKRDWHLHTPEAEEMIAREIQTTAVTKPSNWIFIIGDSAMKEWQTDKALPQEDKRECRYFQTLDEGIHWLTTEGYEMKPADIR